MDELFDLFDEDEQTLNRYETYKKAKRFMKNAMPRIMYMAGEDFTGAKGQIISGMPTGSSDGNAREDKVVLHVQAQEALNAILDACRNMPNDHRTILEYRCFKRMDWNEIYDNIYFGKTKAEEILIEALVMFAYNFVNHMNLLVFYEKEEETAKK
ncbi:hypothetical protein G7084_00150 [Weissella coleopterorum]|uniref:Phage transcriptional regulator, ArpU family n=1 Tax=Weissella coleopterorum TaxID=2714949 RepID=A0A6G8AXP2_9LACO|nr:hypothetical protein [Weissella coleopterorum]QIL49871.1 hypothetical protein G7084_00150 [Weissella coleopterorum]